MKSSTLRSALFSGVLAAFAAVSASALAQPGQHGQHGQHGPAAPAGAQQPGMAGQDMMKTMQDMHRQMAAMQATGDPDHNFAMMMRHHQQAGVDMARTQLKNGKDPQMQAMAKKIIADQTKDIQKLDRWLEKHKASGQ